MRDRIFFKNGDNLTALNYEAVEQEVSPFKETGEDCERMSAPKIRAVSINRSCHFMPDQ